MPMLANQGHLHCDDRRVQSKFVYQGRNLDAHNLFTNGTITIVANHQVQAGHPGSRPKAAGIV